MPAPKIGCRDVYGIFRQRAGTTEHVHVRGATEIERDTLLDKADSEGPSIPSKRFQFLTTSGRKAYTLWCYYQLGCIENPTLEAIS